MIVQRIIETIITMLYDRISLSVILKFSLKPDGLIFQATQVSNFPKKYTVVLIAKKKAIVKMIFIMIFYSLIYQHSLGSGPGRV